MSSSSSSTWVINVDKCTTSSDLSTSRAPCIYKIPKHIAGENYRKLYQPHLVPLGPFHESQLYNSIELVKNNGANHFLLGLKVSSTAYFQILLKLRINLMYPYDDLIWSFDGKKESEIGFTARMLEDGGFIIEILRMGTSNSMDDRNGPFYKNMFLVPVLKQDMLLLENQVPFWFLEFLLFSTDTHTDPEKVLNYKAGDQLGKQEELLDFIIKCYSLPESTRKIKPPYLHILDIYRRGLISQDIHRDEIKINAYIHEETAQYFPTASKLYEAAIPFKKSLTENLTDVSYHRGTLRLPPILITNYTVRTLANLMAFEKLHPNVGNEITSYVFLLSCLVHNARDVSLLESHEIIQHTLGDDEDVVKSLALISNDVAYPPYNMLKDIQIVSQQLKARTTRKLQFRDGNFRHEVKVFRHENTLVTDL